MVRGDARASEKEAAERNLAEEHRITSTRGSSKSRAPGWPNSSQMPTREKSRLSRLPPTLRTWLDWDAKLTLAARLS